MHKFALLTATALLAGCASSHSIQPQLAAATVNFSSATEERVELANFDFTPREIRLRAGRPYDLVLANVGSGGHDFAAPEFFAAAQVRADDAPAIAEGKVDVAGGATRHVHLVPAAGRYELVCTHTGHALLGMKGRIIVD
jgi:uncharacterized cupredoxin-like copper-binding protein